MASSDLPEDVMIHILSWLPVKSVLRFKCVCKSWCALIQTHSFITDHLNHYTSLGNNDGNGTLLVKTRGWRDEDPNTFFLLSDEKFEVSLNLQVPYNEHSRRKIDMLASCNGIICLYDNVAECHFALWNPATREFMPLPDSRFPLPPNTKANPGGNIGHAGFGYDVKTNDYKVVRIVRFKYENENRWVKQVVVYNLSTDSWRLVDTVVPADLIMPQFFPTTYLNGNCHWWAQKWGMEEEMLLSFDISDEVFQSTPLPDGLDVMEVDGNWRSFAVLNESIALILFQCMYLEIEKCFEIWVMKEYGVKESWTKLYKTGPLAPCLGFGWPLGFWKNGELLAQSNEQVVLCDPVTQEIKHLPVYGSQQYSQLLFYKESLVSIKRGIAHQEMRAETPVIWN